MAKKILLVDDNLDNLKVTGMMLEGQGYEIIAAQSGVQAMSKAETEKPDLIILDVMMPDLDGYEVCRRLCTNPATAHVPILMFTAKGALPDQEAGFQAGADDYLTKPALLDELLTHVEAMLVRARRTPARERPAKKAKVVGFLGSKGGVGTTTLAVNIAMALTQNGTRGKQVILADLQSGMSTLSLQLRLYPGGIAELLKQPIGSIQSGMVEAQLQEHPTAVRVLTGQRKPPGMAAPISQGHAEMILRSLEPAAHYLLLDLGVDLSEANRYILSVCDQVVVAIEPQRISLMLAQGLLGELTGSLDLPSHKIGLVMVHKVPGGNATFTKYAIEELLQHDLIGIITPSPDLAFQSSERGMPMILIQPDSVVARQLRDIAEYLRQA